MAAPAPAPAAAPPVVGVLRARGRRLHSIWRGSSATTRWLVLLGLAVTLAFATLAAFSAEIAPYGEAQYQVAVPSPAAPDQGGGAPGADTTPTGTGLPRRAPPQAGFPFGTTAARLDVFSRVVHGTKVAFGVVFLSTLLAMGIGVPLGLVSGYRGGRLDRLLVLSMDALYAFPPLLLAIVVAFVLKQYLAPGMPAAAVAVGATYVPQYYRVLRNHTLSVREEVFVEAARAMGAPTRTVVARYVLPNVVQSVPVLFTLNAADGVLTLAGLGFLGFGVEYPAAEWGLDVARGISDAVSGFWWTALFPGLAITLLVTGLTLLGEGLNDLFNPLLRGAAPGAVRGGRGAVRSLLPRRRTAAATGGGGGEA